TDDEPRSPGERDQLAAIVQRGASSHDRLASEVDDAALDANVVETKEQAQREVVGARRARQECEDERERTARREQRDEDRAPHGRGPRSAGVPPRSGTATPPGRAMPASRASPRRGSRAYPGRASTPRRAPDVNEPVSSGSRTIARPETIQGQGTPLR